MSTTEQLCAPGDLQLNVSSAGVAFELPIEAVGVKSPCTPKSPLTHAQRIGAAAGQQNGATPKRELTSEQIEEKLKAAEMRRAEQQAARGPDINAKVSDAARRRDAAAEKRARELVAELEQRADAVKENRERVIANTVDKAKREEEKVAAARGVVNARMESLAAALAEKIEAKQEKAEELRTAKFDELSDKLAAQLEHVAAVRKVVEQKEGAGDECADEAAQWRTHLHAAGERRDQLLKAVQDRQAEREMHAEEVRARKQSLQQENQPPDVEPVAGAQPPHKAGMCKQS